ncbi:MAG: hypothetical protein ABJO29_09620 [Yoonia sp.]|uniref:hypothetical protein n=4 Tax=Yoonia sp. TaxID=2212373 RepID=UPI003296AF2C
MMLRRNLFGTTVLSATAMLAQSVAADVTGADVWATYTAYYESTGAQVIGTPTTSGDETVISDSALLYRFPFDVATLRVGLPDMRFVDQSDGTVLISYPEAFDVRIEFDVPSEGSGALTLGIAQDNFQGTVSGDPADMTFVQSADALTVEVKDIEVPEEDINFSMLASGAGYSSTSRVVTGDLITTTTEMTTGAADVAYVLNDADGSVISNTGRFGANDTTFETAFPAGGSDIMNLSAALAAGAYLRGTADAEGSSSETITTIDGDILSEQSQSSGRTTSRFSIDAAGFDLFAEGEGVEFNMLIPDVFPFPISGSMGKAVGGYKFPLMPSEEPQDVAMRLDFSDLEISEDLWGLFDPNGDLPRDPASINIDVAGTVISEIDALNFETIEAQMNQSEPPISLESLTINEISVSAIRASALATGAFVVDNTDMTTFDGFPRPEGSAILNVEGANALIDRLVGFGVIGPDEAGMARLGMGFIAKATGDDAFETRLDVNGEGHVIVNGQRMR